MISILIALWVFWPAATAGVLVAAYLGRQAPEGAVVGYLMAGTLAVIGVIAWTLV